MNIVNASKEINEGKMKEIQGYTEQQEVQKSIVLNIQWHKRDLKVEMAHGNFME